MKVAAEPFTAVGPAVAVGFAGETLPAALMTPPTAVIVEPSTLHSPNTELDVF
jgi:hypothetical protein